MMIKQIARQVALISDIHGNLISLQAVLADSARRGVDEVVCLGDTAANGPSPKAVLDLLESLHIPCVLGNADEWLLAPKLDPDADDFHRKVEESDLWTLAQLSSTHLDFLRSFQPTRSLDTPTNLLVFHATPRSNTKSIVATTPVEEIATIFSDVAAPFLAGGHTHQPFVRRFHAQTFINPGSVGLPYVVDRTGDAHNPPWAEYAIISWDVAGGVEIQLVRVPVDTDAIRQAILTSGMPHAEFWAKDW